MLLAYQIYKGLLFIRAAENNRELKLIEDNLRRNGVLDKIILAPKAAKLVDAPHGYEELIHPQTFNFLRNEKKKEDKSLELIEKISNLFFQKAVASLQEPLERIRRN